MNIGDDMSWSKDSLSLFDTLNMYKRLKLFNFLLGYITKSGKLQTIQQINTNSEITAVSEGKLQPRYEYMFIK
jgi:hypothetical protein